MSSWTTSVHPRRVRWCTRLLPTMPAPMTTTFAVLGRWPWRSSQSLLRMTHTGASCGTGDSIVRRLRGVSRTRACWSEWTRGRMEATGPPRSSGDGPMGRTVGGRARGGCSPQPSSRGHGEREEGLPGVDRQRGLVPCVLLRTRSHPGRAPCGSSTAHDRRGTGRAPRHPCRSPSRTPSATGCVAVVPAARADPALCRGVMTPYGVEAEAAVWWSSRSPLRHCPTPSFWPLYSSCSGPPAALAAARITTSSSAPAPLRRVVPPPAQVYVSSPPRAPSARAGDRLVHHRITLQALTLWGCP